MVIDILTGQVQSGKTNLLQKITSELHGNNIRVGGFLSLAIRETDRLAGYDLYDLEKQIRHPFLRRHGQDHWEKIGPYFFIPDSLDLAKRMVLQAEKSDICFVDEVGPSELEGKGLWPALAATLEHPAPYIFLTVRASLLNAYLDKLGKKVDRVFLIDDEDVHARIMAHIKLKFLH